MLIRNGLVCLALGVLATAGVLFAGDGDHAAKSLPNCPVMGEPINFAVSTSTDAGPVFFCCAGCIKKYEAKPAKYATFVSDQRKELADLPKVQTICPVSGKPVDSEISSEIDGKKIQFCCKGCAAKYGRDPGKYAAGLANSYTYQTRCPVTGETIDPASFTKLADGQSVFYCCDGCERKYLGDPSKYAKSLEDQGYQFDSKMVMKAGSAAHDGHEGHGKDDHH